MTYRNYIINKLKVNTKNSKLYLYTLSNDKLVSMWNNVSKHKLKTNKYR